MTQVTAFSPPPLPFMFLTVAPVVDRAVMTVRATFSFTVGVAVTSGVEASAVVHVTDFGSGSRHYVASWAMTLFTRTTPQVMVAPVVLRAETATPSTLLDTATATTT